MKMRTMVAAMLLVASGAASAGDRSVDVQAIARESGLSERQVRMVLGSPSGFAEYRTSFRNSERKLLAIYGRDRVEALARLYRAGLVRSIASAD